MMVRSEVSNENENEKYGWREMMLRSEVSNENENEKYCLKYMV